jgi:hypothetical protein
MSRDILSKDPQISEGEESEQVRLAQAEREWMARVLAGQELKQALGSRKSSELSTIRRYLAKPEIVDRLLDELALSGQMERVNEILGYLATQAAKKALEKGDRNVILALMPKGRAKTDTAKALDVPEGRTLTKSDKGSE